MQAQHKPSEMRTMSCFNAPPSGKIKLRQLIVDSVTEAVKHKHTRSQPRFTRHAVARREREETKEESYGLAFDSTQGRRQRDHEQRRRRKEVSDLPDVRSAAARTLQRRHQSPRGALTSQPLRRRKGPALVRGRHEVWGRATRRADGKQEAGATISSNAKSRAAPAIAA